MQIQLDEYRLNSDFFSNCFALNSARLIHPRIPRGDSARYIDDVASGITPGYLRMRLIHFLVSSIVTYGSSRLGTIEISPEARCVNTRSVVTSHAMYRGLITPNRKFLREVEGLIISTYRSVKCANASYKLVYMDCFSINFKVKYVCFNMKPILALLGLITQFVAYDYL